MIIPTRQQIELAALMKWVYIGDGLFGRGEEIGYYTHSGFRKE